VVLFFPSRPRVGGDPEVSISTSFMLPAERSKKHRILNCYLCPDNHIKG